jgi:hypothetical protein
MKRENVTSLLRCIIVLSAALFPLLQAAPLSSHCCVATGWDNGTYGSATFYSCPENPEQSCLMQKAMGSASGTTCNDYDCDWGGRSTANGDCMTYCNAPPLTWQTPHTGSEEVSKTWFSYLKIVPEVCNDNLDCFCADCGPLGWQHLSYQSCH